MNEDENKLFMVVIAMLTAVASFLISFSWMVLG